MKILDARAPEAEWQSLQLDRNYGESLGFEGNVAFNETLRDADAAGCATPQRWTIPAGLERYEAEYEIRLGPVEGGFVVIDARLHHASLSDPELEKCMRDAWLGKEILFLQHTPVTSARILFPIRVTYHRASSK